MLEMNLILNTNEAIQGTKGKYYPLHDLHRR